MENALERPVVLSTTQWPSLAHDMAAMLVPGAVVQDYSTLCDTYNITPEELVQIIEVPQFRELFQHSLAHFRAQGTRAGIIYRSTTLAQALSEQLFRDAHTGKLANKDSLKLLELLMKSAGLMDQKVEAPTINVNNTVGVQLPLPTDLTNKKLRHLDVVEVSHV